MMKFIHYFVCLIPLISPVSAEPFGSFSGEIAVRWLPDGRNMQTLSDFEYKDPEGQTWSVPSGTRTDGASVPPALFALYPPFSGLYRNAALVHDYYCQKKNRTWQETHDVFYYALRAAGVNETDSNVMWGAVYMFGPRWVIGDRRNVPHAGSTTSPEEQVAQIRKLEQWVKKNRPSKDDTEKAIFENSFDN